MFHKHKFGPIAPDGYQYCCKCGIAHKPDCIHVWSNIDGYEIARWGNHIANMYIQQCTKCGELKKVRIDACSN